MKPRTKIQYEVSRLANLLLPLTYQEEQEGISKSLPSYLYKNKSSANCMDCGADIDLKLIGRKKTMNCPECSKKLEIVHTLDRVKEITEVYFAKCQIVNSDGYEFQLVRNFSLYKYCKKGERAIIHIREVCQNWYDQLSRKRVVFSTIEEWWGFRTGDMEVRSPNHWKQYKPYPECYLSTSKFIEEYAKKGVTHNISGIRFEDLIRDLDNPRIETLLKAKQYWIIARFKSYHINRFWDSIKILMRFKYKVKEKDYQSYIDYLDLLREDKKDLRSPFYICPKDFHKAHQQVLKRVERAREENKWKKELRLAEEKAKKDQVKKDNFYKQKSKYFGIEIKQSNIEIRVLSSIEDYVIESKLMGHCIVSGTYYGRKDTLCLTSTYKGKPAETIEVCLKDFKVLQSRGKKNQSTKYHDQIVKAMEDNMWQIRKIALNEKQEQTA